MRLLIGVLGISLAFAQAASAQDEQEIVANLAAGRVVIHVARDGILFGAINEPMEAKSVPPRVADIDHTHIGLFFGASEWQLPASPNAIRLDHDLAQVYAANPHYQAPLGAGETDLEQMGVGLLEKLRPLVTDLHHKIDLSPDEPLLQIVLIGYGPNAYGPEIWIIDYRVEQEQVSSRENYLSTRPLRPRFTQLYPPPKHDAHTLVEIHYPANLPDVPLLGLIQQNDPRIAKLRASDQRFAKVLEAIERGQANKANTQDSEDLLRAVLPLLAGERSFIQATIGEDTGFRWVVPPSEPVAKEPKTEDKNRPSEAPTLRRRPNPN